MPCPFISFELLAFRFLSVPVLSFPSKCHFISIHFLSFPFIFFHLNKKWPEMTLKFKVKLKHQMNAQRAIRRKYQSHHQGKWKEQSKQKKSNTKPIRSQSIIQSHQSLTPHFNPKEHESALENCKIPLGIIRAGTQRVRFHKTWVCFFPRISTSRQPTCRYRKMLLWCSVGLAYAVAPVPAQSRSFFFTFLTRGAVLSRTRDAAVIPHLISNNHALAHGFPIRHSAPRGSSGEQTKT